MNKYQLTYEDACAISKEHNDFNFYKKEYDVSGFKVVVFNYFLCGYKMFEKPIPERPEINAFDMRGVTFVFNKDDSLFRKYLMLPKFFNINEVESTQYHLLADKRIKSVTVKEDGSLIAFMMLPDGKIFAKTLGGFDNDQVKEAMKIFDLNTKMQIMVRTLLDGNITPMFEYVSFENKIVLNYAKPELKLIGLRDNRDHTYTPACNLYKEMLEAMDDSNISYVKSIEGKSLLQLTELCAIDETIEGFVIEFEDGQLIKCKTKWYFNAHKFRDDVERENNVIKLIIEGKADDFLSFSDDVNFLNRISAIQDVINGYFINKTKEIENLCNCYNGDRKDFAIKYRLDKNFSMAIKYILDKKDIKLIISDYLISKTSKLSDARKFIKDGYI